MADARRPDDDVDFSTWVRRRRSELMLTQEALAERASVAVRTVRTIESGKGSRVRVDTRRLIHQALAEADRPDPPVPVPAQLPLISPAFVDRDRYLGDLNAVHMSGAPTGAAVVAAVCGAPGTGKTAIVVHWAHRTRTSFPDGQLYANLDGFAAVAAPAKPTDVLKGFLIALGITEDVIPAGLGERVTLYRSLMADRRLLVVLDNAADAGQVRPLLPGAPAGMTVITSRSQLTGLVALDGARPIVVRPCDPPEGLRLLAAHAGAARITAETPAASRIVERCGGLPLALGIIGARAALQPAIPLAALADELSATGDRLDILNGGDPEVDLRSVFSWSYHALSAPAAATFRLLGGFPLADVTVEAVAGAAGSDPSDVRAVLADLARAHLITELRPGRYGMHDLLHAYAHELCAATDERTNATGRIRGHYVRTAETAAALIRPYARGANRTEQPYPPPGDRDPVDWFTTERRMLLAIVDDAARTGDDRTALRLAAALETFMYRAAAWPELADVGERSLRSARRLADPADELQAQRTLGRAFTRLGRADRAHGHFAEALRLAADLHDEAAEAASLFDVAILFESQRDYAASLRYVTSARELYGRLGDQAGEASAMNAIGWDLVQMGTPRPALGLCADALTLHRRVGNHHGEAATLDTLGVAHHRLGEYGAAVARLRDGLEIVGRTGDRHLEAVMLEHIGAVYADDGNTAEAGQSWKQALAILDDINHPSAADLRHRIHLQEDARD